MSNDSEFDPFDPPMNFNVPTEGDKLRCKKLLAFKDLPKDTRLMVESFNEQMKGNFFSPKQKAALRKIYYRQFPNDL